MVSYVSFQNNILSEVRNKKGQVFHNDNCPRPTEQSNSCTGSGTVVANGEREGQSVIRAEFSQS